jgi:hypothetical protein
LPGCLSRRLHEKAEQGILRFARRANRHGVFFNAMMRKH